MAERNLIINMEFSRANKDIVEKVKRDFGIEQANYLHFDDGFTFVVLDGDEVVGFISARIRKLPYVEKTFESYIDVIEVRQEYRGLGIARKLLGLSEEESKKKGLYQIRAWSSEDKKEAILMWRNLGFCLDPQEIISEVTKKPVKGCFVIKIL